MTKRNMVKPAVKGIVTIHERKMSLRILRFKAPIPLANPTPTTDPTNVWVVEIGIPILEQNSTVVAQPNSAQNPLLGVMSVILLPTVSITL